MNILVHKIKVIYSSNRQMGTNTAEVYFGAGCFWNSQLIFDQQEGVVNSEVGWCTIPLSDKYHDDQDGRVEVVKLQYDPNKTDLKELVKVFWTTHDPTHEKNEDELYVERSVLIATDDTQLKILSEELKKKTKYDPNILTKSLIMKEYQRAPEKDQKYYSNSR